MHPRNAKVQNAVTHGSGIARAELPRLDLLRSFEASARQLSFTLAADELALTQSAMSRQIQMLEADLGVALFERKHRALALTDAGKVMQRAVVESLERLRDATARVRGPGMQMRQVAITTSPGFASLWLIPRLAKFTANHPGVDVRVSATMEVLDLDRSRIDVAVRFAPETKKFGEPLFEESVVPVCAPQLISQGSHPLRTAADLQYQTLLAVETPQGMPPTADWTPWFEIMGLSGLHMKSTTHFTQYADAIAAAIAGQGVVIGRMPLLNELLREGRLVTPFQSLAASRRAYFIIASARAAANSDAQDFIRWLRAEAEGMRTT